jgi:mannose-6-phosphate isomerase-like protein (cupin superfamily)
MSRTDRPWGYYEILQTSPIFQIKKLVVYPGKRLSLQSHKFRSEHWFVISGSGSAEIESQKTNLTVGTSVDIKVGEKHRLSANSTEELTVIEVQTGTNFDEDDIKRYEDDFGR